MRRRLLGTTLALMLVVAPVGATLCGSCAMVPCPPGMGTTATAATAPAAPEPAAVVADATPPCHQAMAREAAPEPVEATPCHDADTPTDTASMSCCLTAAPPAPPMAVASADGAGSTVVLDRTADVELVPSTTVATARLRDKPPRPAPPPLYTLHASLLI